MKFTTDKLKKIQQSFKRSRYKTGVSSCYIRLTKNIGAKIYMCRKSRDGAAKRQALAAKHLLAPKVGEKFSIELGGYEGNCFGYLTQNAKTYRRYIDIDWKRVRILKEKLRSIGLACNDLHNENVARIGKRVVAIDFCSVSSRKIKPAKGKLIC